MAKAARLVICLDNSGYEVALERRKIYVVVPDAKAEKHAQLRVVDESGQSYLYPEDMFIERSFLSRSDARFFRWHDA